MRGSGSKGSPPRGATPPEEPQGLGGVGVRPCVPPRPLMHPCIWHLSGVLQRVPAVCRGQPSPASKALPWGDQRGLILGVWCDGDTVMVMGMPLVPGNL